MAGSTKRNLLISGLCSFAVYLMPVYSVHISVSWGEILWMEAASAGAGRGTAWFLGDLALAAVLQFTAGALIFWLLTRPRIWSFLVAVTSVPILFIALQAGYLYVLPNLFLIEGESHAEHGDWTTICAVPGAAVAPLEDGPKGALLRAEETWIMTVKGRYARLTADRCRVRNLPIPVRGATIHQIVPGGGALYGWRDTPVGPDALRVLRPGGRPEALERPEGVDHWRPVLARDASAIAWLERGTARGNPRTWRIRVRSLEAGRTEQTIPVRSSRPASFRLVGFDADGPQFIARRNERELVVIGEDGRPTPLTDGPDAATQPTHQILLVPHGWLSWDVYRDEGRLRVAWKLNGKTGRHEVPRGRGINHVSTNPEGTLIAISVGSNVSIGSVKDAVYVIRAADGREVFRRFLPRYTRSRPAFLGNRHIAFTSGGGTTPLAKVLRVPGEVRAP